MPTNQKLCHYSPEMQDLLAHNKKQRQYSPELQDLLVRVEAALIASGKRARKIAEQTGTDLVIVHSVETQHEQLEQEK